VLDILYFTAAITIVNHTDSVPAEFDAKPAHPPVVAFALWLILILAGLALLWVYSGTPGEEGVVPPQWPTSTALERAPGLSTLVMFVHPKCPCSRASLSELATIIAHSGGRLRVDVVFLNPSGMRESWTHTDLWRMAAILPTTELISDVDGREARLFHASVSGETLVYDDSGNLKFHGGITGARGHVGENTGCSSIQAYANTGTIPVTQTPTFGCPLFNDSKPGLP